MHTRHIPAKTYETMYSKKELLLFIQQYCVFDSDEKVYTLFAVSRNKLNKENEKHRTKRVTKVLRDLEKVEEKLDQLEEEFMSFGYNFYIYLSLNGRSIPKAGLDIMQRIAQATYDRNWNRIKSMKAQWDSSLMRSNARFGRGNYMIDLDTKDLAARSWITANIEVLLIRETKNGWHYVCKPFDPRKLDELNAKYDEEVANLKKDDFLFLNSYMMKEGE